MTALADLVIGDSTLLLYFSDSSLGKESKLYYSTHFLEFVVTYVCVLLCKSKAFLGIVAMIVRIKQGDYCL